MSSSATHILWKTKYKMAHITIMNFMKGAIVGLGDVCTANIYLCTKLMQIPSLEMEILLENQIQDSCHHHLEFQKKTAI